MRIIYLFEVPFGSRFFGFYGMDTLLKNGHEIHAWDLTPFTSPCLKNREDLAAAPFNRVNYKSLETKQSFFSALKTVQAGDWVVSDIGYSYEHRDLYRAISRAPARLAMFHTSAIPDCAPAPTATEVPPLTVRLTRKIRGILTDPAKVSRFVFYRFPPKFWGIRSLDLVCAGGEYSLRSLLLGPKTRVLWLHSPDYETYLKTRSSPLEDKGDIVFLDDMYPFHPDYTHRNIPPPLTADRYYPLLNLFFEAVEKKMQRRVVIAAHPKSNYSKNSSYFQGRTIIEGKTAELVRSSSLVLAHFSTSMSFAALFRKPIIFMNFRQLIARDEFGYVEAAAAAFGKKALFIDEVFELNPEEIMAVDENAYSDYVRKYIKSDRSPDESCWESFSRFLFES